MSLRNLLVASAAGLALACIAGAAGAQQIYKWKDASGVTHFSQTPPANGIHYTKMHLTSEPEVTSSPAAPAPDDGNSEPQPSAAPQSAGGNADTPGNRAELCKQLSSNIALLEGKQPVVTGESGKQAVMGDAARQQQLATARAQQTQYCASQGA